MDIWVIPVFCYYSYCGSNYNLFNHFLTGGHLKYLHFIIFLLYIIMDAINTFVYKDNKECYMNIESPERVPGYA